MSTIMFARTRSTLYGFLGRDERACFEALLGAHGVGPALALAIIAVHAPPDLRRAVAADDVDALCLVPGVGKKTAARLLIDLKTRLDVPEIDLTAPTAGTAPQSIDRGALADVRDALTGLGYGPDEVRDAVRDLDGDEDPASDASRGAAPIGDGPMIAREMFPEPCDA